MWNFLALTLAHFLLLPSLAWFFFFGFLLHNELDFFFHKLIHCQAPGYLKDNMYLVSIRHLAFVPHLKAFGMVRIRRKERWRTCATFVWCCCTLAGALLSSLPCFVLRMKLGTRGTRGGCTVVTLPLALHHYECTFPHLCHIFMPWGLVRVRVKERRGDVPVVRLKELPHLCHCCVPSHIHSMFAWLGKW